MPDLPGQVSSPEQEALDRALTASRRHKVGAFNGSHVACECDQRWRSREDHAEHVAIAVVCQYAQVPDA